MMKDRLTVFANPINDIVATLCGLALAAIAMRAMIWWPSTVRIFELPGLGWRILFFSHDDLRVILMFALVTLPLALALARCRTALRWLARIVLLLSIVSALVFGINVTAVQWLRSPITYQWLYYADFLQSFTTQTAVGSVVTARALFCIALALVILMITRHAIGRLLRSPHMPQPWLAPLVMLGLLAGAARFDAPALGGAQYGRIVDPLREFAGTSLASLRSPLSSMKTDAGSEDFRVGAANGPSAAPRLDRRKRNVLLIVLESVSAEDLIGSHDGEPVVPLPNIAALRESGLTFTNMYVPVPSSTRTNFVINTARYPMLTHRPETRTLPDRAFVTIGSRLRQAGYRTSFFMGGDFAYQGVGHFLRDKGFDHLADVETIGCDVVRSNAEGTGSGHGDAADSCVADAAAAWNSRGGAKPFFTIVWTIDTHFPYLAGARETGTRQAYLDSLRSSDAAIGRLVAGLRAQGRLDDTLIAIIGDHGESFGQHGYTFHGNSVFDREVRIPFILSAPGLFTTTTNGELGNLIDLAPTILDLLGLPREPSWEGRSLFDVHRSPRSYFFATKGDLVAGYREGDLKFVMDVWKDRVDMYDLSRDPNELRPITLHGAQADSVKRRLAAWVQYQERLYADE